jgi:hypothetical protein
MDFVITIDTEGDNQWDGGLARSTENIRFIPRFQTLCDRFAFTPTYLCTYEVVSAPEFDDVLLPLHRSGRAEIGAHLHPWTTPPLSEWDRSETSTAYPSELPPGLFARKLEQLTNLLETKLGQPPRSYRAGRWGLSAAHIPILLELGYIVDCSVTPLLSWGDAGARERGQDFSHAPVRPYFMAWGDPAREGASGLLEVPVTILCTNSLMGRSPLLRAIYHRYRKTLPARLLNRTFLLKPRWFRPFSDMSVSRLKTVYDTARRLELPVVEMMFHSSELMPNGSPHNTTPESVEDLYRRLEAIFEYLHQQGSRGVTLSAFAETMRRDAPTRGGVAKRALSSDELTWAAPPADARHRR